MGLNSQFILDMISLYEFAVYFMLFMLSIATNNIYFLVLFIAIFSKQIPERILKALSPKSINKRPDKAFNCDMINQGGDASNRGGFPSGHCTFTSFIATYSVYIFVVSKNKKIKQQITSIMIVSILFAIIMPAVRYLKNCHTITQTLAGFFLGIVWSGMFILLEREVLLKWSLYSRHRNKIWT